MACLASSAVEVDKSAAQQKKEEEKLRMTQLEKKHRNEAIAKAQVTRDAAKLAEEQQKAGEEENEG